MQCIICGVPQGAVLGSLIFLIFVNDMLMVVKCNLFLYANNTCLVFQSDKIKDIKKRLNQDYANMCNCFVDRFFTLEVIKPNLFCFKIKDQKGSQVSHYLQQQSNKTTFASLLHRLHALQIQD